MYKKYVIKFLILVISIIAFLSFINYIIDPFYIYHAPFFNIKPIAEKEAYQNLGMARNLEYDSVITGSSMTENFISSWFDEKFGCKTIKLPFSGGVMKNYDALFKNVFINDRKVKNIFMGLDINALKFDPTKEPDNAMPKYQYDDNIFNDVEYFFNKQVLFQYSLQYLWYNCKNQVPDFEKSYNWEQYNTFSKKAALDTYNKIDYLPLVDKQTYLNYENENLKNLTKYIEENKSATFYLFYPPYSMLYWDLLIRTGEKDACIDILEDATQKLLKYDNVKIYDFQNCEEIVTNLDNYKDMTHYSQNINKFIVDSIYKNEYKLNLNNYQEYFSKKRSLINDFNYDNLFKF